MKPSQQHSVLQLLTVLCISAGQDSAILELSCALVGRACKAAPGSPQYAVEAGYQALLQGDVQGALIQYSRASHLHELDVEAMYGSIECDLLIGKVCMSHSQSQVVGLRLVNLSIIMAKTFLAVVSCNLSHCQHVAFVCLCNSSS